MTNPFTELGLPEPLVKAVEALGYETPTPIQLKAIPELLKGRDVLAAAQTGTGKTAAFALPTAAKMLAAPRARAAKSVRALILAPTRELAAQIDENIRAYCARTTLTSVLVFGGVNIKPQIEALADGCDFLVATPGRLLDHAAQKNVDLSGIEFLVLDEADRMLDMGFIHDIRKILKVVPSDRQTLMFSATFSVEIRSLADNFLTDPVSVEISRNKESALIVQQAWAIAKKRKRELLRDLIVDNNWDQVLVFTRMKHTANRLAAQLQKDGIVAAAIHGNKSQSARTKALAGFKDRSIRVLVATDIAARGLDIEGLPHVINYELPNVAEDYVHRIGRTGRAGLQGHAVSLVCDEEKPLLAAIEKLLKKKIELAPAQGYDGEVPEDIARDEAERDKARAAELARMREARRKQRKNQNAAKNTAKTEVAKEVQAAVAAEAAAAGISENPDERFEKKIRRKAPFGKAHKVTARTEVKTDAKSASDGKAKNGRSTQPNRANTQSKTGARNGKPRRNDDNFGNTLDYKPRTKSRRSTAQWEPVDPFAPEHQAIFLPQVMPGNNVYAKQRDNKNPRRAKKAPQQDRSRANNIKSTVARSADQNRRLREDPRFESVSSNLPPGMILRFRRR